jgi:D-beta-D-heptose 7-phosphate kinase/D-beta-D-heptose 1-phosphate adenosyltransferase
MLDEYIWGDVHRISPEAPVPVVSIRRRSRVPGGAANTAANVAGLGGRALLGGVVGDDYQAETLRAALDRLGLSSAGLLVDGSRVTTAKTRVIAHNQQVVRIDGEQTSPLSPDLEEALLGWVEGQLGNARGMILSDYSKGVISDRVSRRLIDMGRAAGKPVVVDPKGLDFAKYRGVTVVKPNVHEAERAVGFEIRDEQDLQEAGRRLIRLLDGSALLITRGALGMSLFRAGSAPLHIPSVARDVFDVTGAGDTVASTLALGLATGFSLEEAAWLANQAAGLAVGKVGTAAVSSEELAESLPRSWFARRNR